MTLLLFKLFSAPAPILAVTLVGRRYGQAVAGWLLALPLTSGPVVVLLAIEHDPRFAQQAAEGSLTGTIAQATGPDRVGLFATFPAFIAVPSALAHGFDGAGAVVTLCAAVIVSLTAHRTALRLMRR
ncbi:MAG: hypothetical protein J0L91_12360 [Burkholderiales bacterium]|nr:hypothetical protein [Burkholderiales bacterium]MCC7113938.1 hypothetical protein [Burkholderiales bacterium]